MGLGSPCYYFLSQAFMVSLSSLRLGWSSLIIWSTGRAGIVILGGRKWPEKRSINFKLKLNHLLAKDPNLAQQNTSSQGLADSLWAWFMHITRSYFFHHPTNQVMGWHLFTIFRYVFWNFFSWKIGLELFYLRLFPFTPFLRTAHPKNEIVHNKWCM